MSVDQQQLRFDLTGAKRSLKKPSALDFFDRIADCGWHGEDLGRNAVSGTYFENLACLEVEKIAAELSERAKAKGLEIFTEKDAFGNVYVILRGESDKAVLIGSHIDSVPKGGRYDGVLGVAGGLEIINKFVEEGNRPKNSIKVAAFRSEESSVTGRACFGSAVAAGKAGMDDLRGVINSYAGGIPMAQIIAHRDGISEEQLAESLKNPYLKEEDLAFAMEIHTEQASVLEDAKQGMAMVDAIGSARRSRFVIKDEKAGIKEKKNIEKGNVLKIKVRGFADHSGAAPMTGEIIEGKQYERKDAVFELMRFFKNANVIFNVLDIRVPSGSYNVVPGECEVDFYVENEEEEKRLRELLDEKLALPYSFEVTQIDGGEIDKIRDEVVDALAKIIVYIEMIGAHNAKKTEGKVRATVGNITINKESNELAIFADQRKLSEVAADKMDSEIHLAIEKVRSAVAAAGIFVDERDVRVGKVTDCDPDLMQIAKEIYRQKYNRPIKVMGSMPGHDLSNIPGKKLMFYVRSTGGSHNPGEGLVEDEDFLKVIDFVFEMLKTEIDA